MAHLRGISWDHPRGLQPLVDTAPLYEATHPGVTLAWEARSLLRFGEDPLDVLAERYDLLIIDHPFIGYGAATACVLPLDELLAPEEIATLRGESVGPSFVSYEWDGHVWALPVDAAAQVAVARDDLLARAGVTTPTTWPETVRLGAQLREHGLAMAMPMSYTDLVPTFYTLAASLGHPPLQEPVDAVLPEGSLDAVLDLLLELRDACHPDSIGLDPPHLLERMAGDDEVAYCPLAFGYSNYARSGFRLQRLRFTDIPSPTAEPRGATLGGAGIAVSARCSEPEAAARYAAWIASAEVQRGAYLASGGQPANRVAWLDDEADHETGGFFSGTMGTLDHAFLRPRWAGYTVFQDRAGPELHRFVTGAIDRAQLCRRLDDARMESQRVRGKLTGQVWFS